MTELQFDNCKAIKLRYWRCGKLDKQGKGRLLSNSSQSS